MVQWLTVVTKVGQITIPEEVRDALGLKEGDQVAVDLVRADTHKATIRPARSVAERTFGSVHWDGPPLDFKELRRQFEKSVTENATAEGHSPDESRG